MRNTTSYSSLVITNFSMACRISSAKPFTIYQQGTNVPLPSSDIYIFVWIYHISVAVKNLYQ